MIKLKKHKPTSPGLRGLINIKCDILHKGQPYKKLTIYKKRSSGRNNAGRKGGGHKKKYRIIDWKRNKYDMNAKIERVEYDPNRSSYIALLLYPDGERRYILHVNNLKEGNFVLSGFKNVPIKNGNSMPLSLIPLGTYLHCIELIPGSGAVFARSAGCYAQLLAKDKSYATIRLRSGEIRKVLLKCFASIGIISKGEHNLQKVGKAGRNRWKNNKPKVRGVAMNPVDHPLGGGEGRSSGGRHPCNPWGLLEGKVTKKSKKRGYKKINIWE